MKEFNNCCKSLEPKNEEHDKFPDFLFPTQFDVDEIKALMFTEEEQELYGLLKLYNKTLFAKKGTHKDDDENDFYISFDDIDYLTYSHDFAPFLPYEYVEKKGVFKIYNMYRKIASGRMRFYDDVISEYLINHPNVIFNVNNLSSREIFDMFKPISYDQILQLKTLFSNNETVLISQDDETFVNKELLNNLFELRKYVTHIHEESNDPIYKQERQKFLNDSYKLTYKEYKGKNHYKGRVYLVLTKEGKELINWYTKEFCPNEEIPFKDCVD